MTHQRFVLLSFIVGAALTGMALRSAAVSLFAQFAWQDALVLDLMSTSTAMALGGAALTFVALIRNTRAIQFTDETVGELLKVTWPTRDETVRASTTVVITTLFTAALLAAYDFLWKNLADLVLFTG